MSGVVIKFIVVIGQESVQQAVTSCHQPPDHTCIYPYMSYLVHVSFIMTENMSLVTSAQEADYLLRVFGLILDKYKLFGDYKKVNKINYYKNRKRLK